MLRILRGGADAPDDDTSPAVDGFSSPKRNPLTGTVGYLSACSKIFSSADRSREYFRDICEIVAGRERYNDQ